MTIYASSIMLIYVIVAVVSYLLGSIPFGYILVRLFRGEDVRATGSGNIGATNVMRSGSKGLGIATLILDASKGYCAVALAAAFATSSLAHQISSADSVNRSIAMALAAAFAILGHIFPVWLKFKGGKGVATGVGSFLALAPKAVLVVLADLRRYRCCLALRFARIHRSHRRVSGFRLAPLSR